MKKLSKIFAVLLAACMSMTVALAEAETAEFSDVAETDYFYPAVQWGLEAGITQGVGDNLFAPDGEVTRAQVVTFLWNMEGKPAPTTEETFADVEAGSWYETAVKWAVENEVTAGTGDGLFSPDTFCDRAMCISLLYRMMDAPLDGIDLTAPSVLNEDMSLEDMSLEDFGNALMLETIKGIHENNVISDVEEGAYYDLPVIWACLNGIITEDNTNVSEEGVLFRPTEPCVRKEMISFLYQTKLMQDAANAPATYELGPITLPIPQEYMDLVFLNMYGVTEYEDDEDIEDIDETVVIVSERESREAVEAMGEEDYEAIEGAGELFRIIRVSENRLNDLLSGDMADDKVFAKDEKGGYYILCYPTDVRYVRETNDEMNEDIEQWTELNEWARGDLQSEIMKYSKGLSEIPSTDAR